ncbi:MAG: glycosyltransferase family 9 protein [Armatimonadetes bacterium]|nr:glycosyltransferase family 9 protein [Armatimonadota bacterium]
MITGDPSDNQTVALPGDWSQERLEAFCAEREAGEIRRVLCIHTGFLEDVIQALPCVHPLVQGLQRPEIAFLTSPYSAQVLGGHPELHNILSSTLEGEGWLGRIQKRTRLIRSLRKEKFDLAIDFTGGKSSPHELSSARYRIAHSSRVRSVRLTRLDHLRLVRALGFSGTAGAVRLPYGPEHVSRIHSFLEAAPRPWIGIHPGSPLLLQRWPTERFTAVARRLERYTGGTILITSGSGEGSLAQEVGGDLRMAAVFAPGALSWTEIQALVAQLDLVISNDSPVLHLARGVDTPTVGIFGPSMCPERNDSDRHTVLMAPLSCRTSCNSRWCSDANFHTCIDSIQEDDVLESALRGLKAGRIGATCGRAA